MDLNILWKFEPYTLLERNNRRGMKKPLVRVASKG